MNPASQPLVSVVVPAHNEVQHIRECIESVLAQTHQNWECIIVDNCSTDGTGEIAREYAAKDPRIRVCRHAERLRAVANFNCGLRQISGASKYCKIVFADDWIFPECLESMVAVAEEHPSVGIVGAFALKGNQVICTGLPYPSRLVSGREICRRLFLNGLYLFGSATSLLYRSDIVRARDPFFDESNFHSDLEVCVALLKTWDFGFVHQVLTFSRVRPGSLESVSSDIQTFKAGELHVLVAHGADFLTPKEFKSCMDFRISDYYATLVGGLLRNRDQRFWEYHKKKLKEAGVGFNRVLLAKVALRKLIAAVLNPGASVGKAKRIANEVAYRRRS